MTYGNKFVMTILVNGQIQKEFANGMVTIPLGSEYTIRFRNKHTDRRAVVKFSIDGEDVSGPGYVIDANDVIEIKRHHDKDEAFVFVSLDSVEATDYGKNGPNPDKVKGTIKARFYLEKKPPVVEHHHHYHHDHYYRRRTPWSPPMQPYFFGSSSGGDGILRSKSVQTTGLDSSWSASRSSESFQAENIQTSCNASPDQTLSFTSAIPTSSLQEGCTVPGEATGQRFGSTYIDIEDNFTPLCLFLQGYETEKPVKTRKQKAAKAEAVSDLEEENAALREKLAKLENERLKEQLAKLEAK